MGSPAGRVALITGCSSGFGLLTAQELAAAGFLVFPSMRDLTKRRKELDGFEVLELDVTKPETMRTAVETVVRKAGRIDVLVNNAGMGIGGFFEDSTDEEIRRQFETNFFGLVEMTRQVLPIMRVQGGGRIINVSSIGGLVGSPVIAAYVATKHAVEGFSESLAIEVAAFGIRIVLIEPGMYRTEIFGSNRRMAQNAHHPDSPYLKMTVALEGKINAMLTKSRSDPAEVARAIRKAATAKNPKARYLLGTDAKVQAVLKWVLPDRWRIALVRKISGLG
jgi:NAD(P)-dependent dehydrogenase (short-subunit alcohol dehydrogenase family)